MRRKKKIPKKKKYDVALNNHAKKRVWERYSIEFTNADLNKIIAKIHNGDAVFVEGKTNTRTVHKIEYEGTDFLVLYSRSMKRIVTFLPMENYHA
jgi:hypothetical protein